MMMRQNMKISLTKVVGMFVNLTTKSLIRERRKRPAPARAHVRAYRDGNGGGREGGSTHPSVCVNHCTHQDRVDPDEKLRYAHVTSWCIHRACGIPGGHCRRLYAGVLARALAWEERKGFLLLALRRSAPVFAVIVARRRPGRRGESGGGGGSR